MVVIPIARGPSTGRAHADAPTEPAGAHAWKFSCPEWTAGRDDGVDASPPLVLGSGQLRAIVVFTGELVDADGTRVGVGSRRAIVPAEIVRSANGISLSVGPLDVDLLGLHGQHRCLHP